jgi:hypothetical protein
MRGRRLRVALAFCAASLCAWSRASAQASPYVPLDDPAYVYVNALLARGALRDVGLLERPLTVTAIRRAMATTDTARMSRAERGWVRRLRAATARFAPPVRGGTDSSGALALHIAPGLRAVAQTSGQRELMLSDEKKGVFPGASLRMSASAGRVIAAARLMADNRLVDDPEFRGKTDRWVRGRMEDAYVSAQWPLGELFFGRTSRNWGPPTLQGLHLGSAPYSYDHLAARLGPEQLHLGTILTRLEPLPTGRLALGPAAQRYLAVHRLAARVRSFELAASESYLYSGVGRGMSFSISNPLNLYNLAQYNEAESGNVGYSLDVAWRGGRAGPWIAAQLFVDDVQVDDCAPQCQEPSSWGVTVTTEGLPSGATHRAFASYTRVTNLVYRTPDPTEIYASFGVSLGRAFTDYDELRAGVDLALFSVAPVRVYVAKRRQGEGDYRLPFPDPPAYASTPHFLAGRVQSVSRVGLEGGMSTGDLAVSWDLGVNHSGVKTRPEGRIILRWEPAWATISALAK